MRLLAMAASSTPSPTRIENARAMATLRRRFPPSQATSSGADLRLIEMPVSVGPGIGGGPGGIAEGRHDEERTGGGAGAGVDGACC